MVSGLMLKPSTASGRPTEPSSTALVLVGFQNEYCGPMRAAVGDRDPAAIAAIAHGLRGSSASLGARRLALRCEQIEAVAAAAGTAELQALLAEAEFEFARAEKSLRKQFSTGRAG